MKLSEISHRLIAEESRENPSFGRKLRSMIASPDGDYLLSVSARKAVANEFDPTLYPESRGEWIVLRRAMSEGAAAIAKRVRAEVDRLTLDQKMEKVRAIARGEMPQGYSGMGELGQAEALIPIFGSLFSAGSSVYGSHVISEAQKDVAKIMAESEAQRLQLQLEIAQATQAIKQIVPKVQEYNAEQAEAESPELPTTSTSSGATGIISRPVAFGIPLWAIPAGVGVLALAYFAFKKRGK